MTRVTLTIEELGAQGDGIAHFEGAAVYAPAALPGDEVEATLVSDGKQSFKATKISRLKDSDYRVTAPCQHFGKCGGCSLQHVDNGYYQQWIVKRIKAVMGQHGFEGLEVLPPQMSPAGSRRRINLKALKIKNRVVLGYHQRQSHQLVDLAECPVARPELAALIAPLRQCLAGFMKDRQQAEVYLTKVSSGVELVLKLDKEPELDTRLDLTDFANKHDLAAVSTVVNGFQEIVIERRAPLVKIAGVEVKIPPAAFLQATEEGEAAMIAAVLKALPDDLPKKAKGIDLFAGVGTFSFALGHHMAVLAAEGAKDAIDALKVAYNRLGGTTKAIEVAHRDLFRRPVFAHELADYSVAVIDPPRAGATAQMAELAKSSVPTIIAISCNPNTFARDARQLVDGGYEIGSIQPIGQFLWSTHIELVAVFKKKES